ncbi:MAG: hypothetical protein Q9209_002786 [Squamulea sp. 1 TL-2023]
MINQNYDSIVHLAQETPDPASTSPANGIQGYTSSAIPVVAGFTPINQYFSPSTLQDTNQTPVPVLGANKGRKRQKKASPPATVTPKTSKTARSRQPKKAKKAAPAQEQTITQAFNITKPLEHDYAPLHAKRSIAVEPSAHAYPSTGTIQESPLQTCQDPSSKDGLGPTYQAAFQQQPPTVPEKSNGDMAWSNIAEENSQGLPSATCFQSFLPSASGNTVQLHSPDRATSAISELKSASNGTLAGFTCQVLNPLGVMLPGQQYLAEPGHEDWNMTISKKIDLAQVLPMNSEQDEAPNTLPEPFRDSDALSFSSLMDIVLSRYDNKLFSSSTSRSFIESSSPCLQSPSGRQSVPNHKASPIGFSPNKQSSKDDNRDGVGIQSDDEMYDDEELETGFLDFQSPTSAQVPPPSPPASPNQKRTTKTQWASPDMVTPATSPAKSITPSTTELTPSTPALATKTPTPKDIPHRVSFDENGAPIPFIRPVFPKPIRDRSPVLGLSSKTVLRTCFRIGEALNAGSTALRTRTDAVIELYARVTFSERPAGSVKQLFHFADIFSPDKPPFLKGTYGLWKGVPLWDADSKAFLGEDGKGKMCRVVGRIGREERTRGLEMTVLSVWQADWEDVGIVKGIYCG